MSDELPHKAVSDALSQLEALDLSLERDLFLRKLISELAFALEKTVGVEEASGFISLVGQAIGEWINREYRDAYGQLRLDPVQVASACVDLKRRIQGDFFVISIDADKIIFGNRACPFGNAVKGRPSLCMMTSNVFGTIAAENLGYSKVRIDESIAQGHAGCQVTLFLSEGTAAGSQGREYYGL
ncbi:methanogen output domain 1-containing protein [Thioalkalivibrio sp. ALJ7]|uniref:methanogen output domain 1-containing protein n=1 Tax=Thioalkalivibrio sp. ALJ7 TaxID=1158756 RepID=UPI000375B943|nr:methanogen output domain 1-containing protein [Thioalkalivibrio sp. ALJ7]